MTGDKSPSGAPPVAAGAGFCGVVDAVLFLGVLGFWAVAIVALAVAAPLALAITAVTGLFTAGRRRGGWRLVEAG